MIQEEKFLRYQIVKGILLLFSAILIIALAKIQLFNPSYSSKASSITLNQNLIYPSRGLLYDRNGKILVINYPTYDLLVTYKAISPDMDTALFCKLLQIDRERFISGLQKDWKSGKYSKSVPFIFLKSIPPEIFLPFKENLFRFPGFSSELRSIRGYPEPHGANFLGYISEATPEDIEHSNGLYRPGDYVGCAGLEKYYEDDIRGINGVEFILKDNLGREVGNYESGRLNRKAISGKDIQLSIDLELQRYGDSLMLHKVGGIVAIEPATGEILCQITSPTFDPNLMSVHNNRGLAYSYLLRDSLKPLFDRSANAKYPPGSIFKPVLSLIAMQEGVLNENTGHTCTGAYYYKTVSYGCHTHPSPGNLQIALQHSCNAYFIQTFRDLIEIKGFSKPQYGLDLLGKYLTAFGLGRPLYSDVATESSGSIPTSEYYTRLYKTDQWRSTYFVSVGIGQGELELTTLQMANLAAIIANKGYYMTPHLIKTFDHGAYPIPEKFRIKNKVPVDEKHFNPVINGMELAVRSGTAFKAYYPEISICGKTGTSQNPHGEDHSVFFAFAPKDQPKIAIAVYVENAGWGGEVAAPMASLMIEKYLNREVKRRDLHDQMVKKDLITKKKKT
ncbi:MAG: penicillin-binding protein 2 [Saprospiraceae bacterium]|nr:penicillin-binding protein 2 [Saprospiraceae bacterium]